MTAKWRIDFRICLTGLMVLSICSGCAALDRKLEDSALTRKMWDWQRSLREKLSIDEPESTPGKKPPPAIDQTASPAYFVHQICWPGETLSLISKWYTGRFQNWQLLAAHNPEIDPKRIRIGQRILIPENILITHQPLPQKVAAKCLPGYFAYTVQRPGESLARIAGWYTGDPQNWQALAAANPDLDPGRLAVGHEIYIPRNLLKTRKSPPQAGAAVSGPESQETPPPAEPAAAPVKQEELRLFGPKQFPKG